jgi:hypothetical protein
MAERKRNYGLRRGMRRKQTLADSETNQAALGPAYNSTSPERKDSPRSQRTVPTPYRPSDVPGTPIPRANRPKYRYARSKRRY